MATFAAARVTDPFGHDAALEGVMVGIVLGALVAAGTLATGGMGTLVVGAALATPAAAGLIGGLIGMTMDGPDTGDLQIGSTNVFVNDLPATMAFAGKGPCRKHAPALQHVADGSGTVRINNLPAARVTSRMGCGAVIRAGSSNVFIGGLDTRPVCLALGNERMKLAQFRIDSQAAVAAYDPPDKRTAPDGHRNATVADLARLRLTPEMLEHPIDPATGQPSEFRAAVFIDDRTGAALIAYKGTTSWTGQDMATNRDQGLGRDTFYYRNAQDIARSVARSPGGAGARLTGHSLGGSMAAAGGRASGLQTTTFNSAGLHANTVPQPLPGEIDDVYVRGEAVRASQSIPFMPKSAGTRRWPLEPARTGGGDWQTDLPPALASDRSVLGRIARSGLLHMMANVDLALAQKGAEVEKAIVDNGC